METQRLVNSLLKTKNISLLKEVNSYVNESKLCIDCQNEYNFLETRSHNQALEMIETFLIEKIKKLENSK
jgi:hypothetical protein